MIRRSVPFVIAVVAPVMAAACGEGNVFGPDLDDAPLSTTLPAVITARAPAASGQHPVHLRGAGTAALVGWCDEGAGVFRLATQGEGTAGHLGRFYLEESACRSIVTGAVTEGEATIVAANGDRIYATWSGQVLDPTGLPEVIDAIYELGGGTGRFASATGLLEVRIRLTSDTTWVVSGSGWISY